jgi:hypothetical protein
MKPWFSAFGIGEIMKQGLIQTNMMQQKIALRLRWMNNM